MPLVSPAANANARRLFAAVGARTTRAPTGVHDPVAVAQKASMVFADGLSRWFGPYGYHALLTRALAQARTEHPVLVSVHIRAPLAPVLEDLNEAAQVHGAAALSDGVVGLLAALLGLLGRLIGEDMALQLIERSMEVEERSLAQPPQPWGMPSDGGLP